MNNIHQKETESTVVGLCLPILFMVLVLQLLDNLLLLAQREKKPLQWLSWKHNWHCPLNLRVVVRYPEVVYGYVNVTNNLFTLKKSINVWVKVFCVLFLRL